MDHKLLYYPDERLRRVAEPVGEITDELRDLVPRMFEIMYDARGIGLAGPQIGFGKRIVVGKVHYGEDDEGVEEVYLNPEIVERVGGVREEEGCLSLPGLYTNIERSEEVTVRYLTLDGEKREVTVGGLHSRLFQHEIDHLDGILIVDKMSPAEKKHWAPLLQDLEEQHAENRTPPRPAPSRTGL